MHGRLRQLRLLSQEVADRLTGVLGRDGPVASGGGCSFEDLRQPVRQPEPLEPVQRLERPIAGEVLVYNVRDQKLAGPEQLIAATGYQLPAAMLAQPLCEP